MKRFLIIDDESDILSVMDVVLNNNFECSVKKASNGLEALDKLFNEKFDCILTDYMMPQMNGAGLVSAMRKSECPNKDTPFIIVTAHSKGLDLENLAQYANVKVVEKPVDWKSLIKEIEAISAAAA